MNWYVANCVFLVHPAPARKQRSWENRMLECWEGWKNGMAEFTDHSTAEGLMPITSRTAW